MLFAQQEARTLTEKGRAAATGKLASGECDCGGGECRAMLLKLSRKPGADQEGGGGGRQ